MVSIGMGPIIMSSMPLIHRQLAYMYRTERRALSTPRAKHAAPCTRCAQAGVTPRVLASLAVCRTRPGRLHSVARPWQAEHALCMWAVCQGFGRVAVFK
jgi:hypothetical protein